MRRFTLFGVFMAVFWVVGISWATPPTPPIQVQTTFKPGEAAAGVLTIEAKAHQSVSGIRVLVSMPTGFALKALDGLSMEAKQTSKERMEYSLVLAKPIERGGAAFTAIELSAGQAGDRGTSEIEVRVVALTDTGGTAVGHASLFATVKEGRLVVQTPKEFQRELRIAAEKTVQENVRKEPGLTVESVLPERVIKLDEAAIREADAKGDPNALQVLPSGLNSIEQEAFVDRSREVEAELDPLTVRGRAFFVDLDGVLRPLVNATVRIMDDDFGPDEHITSTITGWDGRFSTVINNSDGLFQNGRDIYIRILTSNSRFRMEDCTLFPDWTWAWRADDGSNLADGTIVDFGSFSLAGSTNGLRAAMIFQRLNSAWTHFTSVGAQDPGFVDGCYPESSSHYNTFWGDIYISGDDFDSRDTIVHEWGHAIQDKAQPFYESSGGEHTFCGLTTKEQAFNEGWATFVALDVFPDNHYNWNPGDTGRELESYFCGGSASTAAGFRDEGRVAAALIDLRDATNDCANGCGSTCDANAANRVTLPTIWRDAMWGTIGFATNDAFEFWRELCPVLSATQRPLAVNIFDYNCLDVTSCVVLSEVLAQVRQGVVLDDKDVYPALIRLRDELKKTEAGGQLVQAFFRMVPALTEHAEKSSEAKEALAGLSTRFALAATWLTDEKGRYESEIPVTGEFLRDYDVAVRQISEAGGEGASDLSVLRDVLESLEGRSVAEVRAKLAAVGKK